MNPLTAACCTALAACFTLSETRAQVASKESAKPRFDIRLDDPVARAAVQAHLAHPGARAQRRSAAELTRASPDLSIDFDEILGTPSFIRSSGTFLTAAADPAAWLTTLREYVADHRDLFGVDPGVLDHCRVARDLVTRHNGVRSVTLQEQIEEYDLIGATLLASFTSGGELINAASTLIPTPGGPLAPVLIQGAPGARRAIFPMSRLDLRPAWMSRVPETGTGNLYEVTVDAADGRLLARRNLTLHATSATYNVYSRSASDPTPADSPSPQSPTSCTPGVTQPPIITRSSQTLASLSATASPNGWIDPLDS